ncbi:MAG: aspartate kinase [Phycisphaerales bacterium]
MDTPGCAATTGVASLLEGKLAVQVHETGQPGSRLTVVVQKFGGSSVGDAGKMRLCAQRVIEERRAGKCVVVVVSAMGDATDDLIALTRSAADVPDRRELDQILATGEQVSVGMMAIVLQGLGVPAVSLTGAQAGIRTDAAFGRAMIEGVDTTRLIAELRGGRVPVVCGFQGVTAVGEITTLGRGGSDTTAVALAAALIEGGHSASCDIYKDVEGVYTADPRVVPEARRREVVTYDEMLEAAALGAQVIHPRAVELAKKFGAPLRVLHSHRPGGTDTGTLVLPEDPSMESRVVSSVVLKRNVGRVSLRGLRNRAGVQATVFGPIAASGISVDDIIQEDDGPGTINLTFTFDRHDLAEMTPIVHRIAAAEAEGSGAPPQAVRFDVGLSTVSAVGAGMRTSAGVAAMLFDAMAAEKIQIENITTSEIRISCVVAEKDGERALRAMHQAFGLASPVTEAERAARATR